MAIATRIWPSSWLKGRMLGGLNSTYCFNSSQACGMSGLIAFISMSQS